MTATAERVVLDTDVVSRLQDGSLPVALRANLAGMSLLVSFITIGELFLEFRDFRLVCRISGCRLDGVTD